jgi:hypothetical protein
MEDPMKRLSFFPAFVAAAALCAVTALAADDDPDYQKLADAASWEWHPEQASVLYSTMTCPKEYKVEIVRPPNTFGDLTIRFFQDDKLSCAVSGHAYTTFIIDAGVLYYADYSHSGTGCALVAYDLIARKQMWKTDLEGIGPIDHSRYTNQVIVQMAPGSILAPRTILVRGNEAAGKYIEYVDTKTHKTVGHKIFEKGFKDK